MAPIRLKTSSSHNQTQEVALYSIYDEELFISDTTERYAPEPSNCQPLTHFEDAFKDFFDRSAKNGIDESKPKSWVPLQCQWSNNEATNYANPNERDVTSETTNTEHFTAHLINSWLHDGNPVVDGYNWHPTAENPNFQVQPQSYETYDANDDYSTSTPSYLENGNYGNNYHHVAASNMVTNNMPVNNLVSHGFHQHAMEESSSSSSSAYSISTPEIHKFGNDKPQNFTVIPDYYLRNNEIVPALEPLIGLPRVAPMRIIPGSTTAASYASAFPIHADTYSCSSTSGLYSTPVHRENPVVTNSTFNSTAIPSTSTSTLDAVTCEFAETQYKRYQYVTVKDLLEQKSKLKIPEVPKASDTNTYKRVRSHQTTQYVNPVRLLGKTACIWKDINASVVATNTMQTSKLCLHTHTTKSPASMKRIGSSSLKNKESAKNVPKMGTKKKNGNKSEVETGLGILNKPEKRDLKVKFFEILSLRIGNFEFHGKPSYRSCPPNRIKITLAKQTFVYEFYSPYIPMQVVRIEILFGNITGMKYIDGHLHVRIACNPSLFIGKKTGPKNEPRVEYLNTGIYTQEKTKETIKTELGQSPVHVLTIQEHVWKRMKKYLSNSYPPLEELLQIDDSNLDPSEVLILPSRINPQQ